MSNHNPWDEPGATRQPPPVEVRGSYEPRRLSGPDAGGHFGGQVLSGGGYDPGHEPGYDRGYGPGTHVDPPPGRDQVAWADHEPDIWVDGAGHPTSAPPPPPPPPPGASAASYGPGPRSGPSGAPEGPWPGYDDPAVGPDEWRGYDEGADGYLPPDEVPAPWADDEAGGRREQRRAHQRQEAQAREQRWQRNRLAVPYAIDGPKVTFGLVWFVVALVAIVAAPLAVGLVTSSVAALAGLQTAHAWYPGKVRTKWWAAAAAFCTGMAGVLAPIGVLVGAVLGSVVLLVHVALEPQRNRTVPEQLDIALRSALPVGIAAASLAGLRTIGLGPVLVLMALVSAYEVGDFLVGTGSKNAVEGPLAGIVAVAVVGFVARLVAPAPFTPTSVILFTALTAVCCPLGQILGAALLPRGSAWAPALRRLDSYLLAAPLWLLLLASLHSTTTL